MIKFVVIICFIVFSFVWMLIWLKIFENPGVGLFFYFGFLLFFSFMLGKSAYGCLFTNPTAGTVYDKEIINAERIEHLYTSNYIPTRYRLYIGDEVEINGKMYQRNAQYDVSEDIYYMYDNGDWFDSQNPQHIYILDNEDAKQHAHRREER